MKKILSVFLCIMIFAAASMPFSALTRYDGETVLLPLWEGDTVYDEAVCVLQNSNRTFSPVTLTYKIDEILSVRNASLTVTYEEGVDYALEDGKLVILANTRIPYFTDMEYYPYFAGPTALPCTEGGYIFFAEGTYFHERQIVVTYRHSDSWEGPVPERQLGSLPGLAEKLESQTPLRILFYGDSITVGANSSSFISARPYLAEWPLLVTNALRDKYDYSQIYFTNNAVGGVTSTWGRENAYLRAAIEEPDLAVIAFGMNDGNMDPAVYEENIKGIIAAIREESPDCEFVLVGGMLPNALVTGALMAQETNITQLRKIAAEDEGVAVADMTSLHAYLLSIKSFRDMTGNNVNHPNDFLSRLYAQLMLQTLSHSNLSGDTDLDGVLTTEDAVLCMNSVISDTPLTGQALLNADADGNGVVNTSDVRAILRRLVD